MPADHRAGRVHTGRERSARFGELGPGASTLEGAGIPPSAGILEGAGILTTAGALEGAATLTTAGITAGTEPLIGTGRGGILIGTRITPPRRSGLAAGDTLETTYRSPSRY